ncbi:hypothetical protein NMG60_11005697 [Bertholletia excelsa]
MGTKLQFAINPLANSSPQNNSFSASCQLDDWDCSRKQGVKGGGRRTLLINFQDSMDRMLEHQTIDSIKKTMLIQEEIFKQQVSELHRLYSVQKMLMDEIRNGIKQTKYPAPINGPDCIYSNLFDPNQSPKPGPKTQFQAVGPTSSRERSGSCSGEPTRVAKGFDFDLERPAEEEEPAQAGPSGHNHKKNPGLDFDGYDEEGEVELTLSIGGGSGSKKTKKPTTLGLTRIRLDRGEECGNPNTALMSPGPGVDQQRKQDHWLFQGLSLNRT